MSVSFALCLAAGMASVSSGDPAAAIQDRPSITNPQAPSAPTRPVEPRESIATVSPDQASDIVITARATAADDPLAPVNLELFKGTQLVDRALVGPVAKTYEHVVPEPIRGGLRNFFNNLHEPVVFLNYVLQFKPGKASETAGRFFVNSTLGGLGFVDIAKRRPFGLPRRQNGFANTLGFYGIGSGPFLFLPLVGPTTLRDLVGGLIDRGVTPLYLGFRPFNRPTFGIATGAARLLDRRVTADERIMRERGASDLYGTARADYFQRRALEIDGLHSGAWRLRKRAKGLGGILPTGASASSPVVDFTVPADVVLNHR